MNELINFDCAEFGSVRIININGEPWFVGSDIARALGYANPQEAVRVHCKGVRKMRTPSGGQANAKQ